MPFDFAQADPRDQNILLSTSWKKVLQYTKFSTDVA